MAGTLDRITFDPKIMEGRACIRGMRMTVALVLNLLANGATREELRIDYPDLEDEDIAQSLRYAALIAQDSYFPLGVNNFAVSR